MKYSINFDSTFIPIDLRAKKIKNAGFNSTFLYWGADKSNKEYEAEVIRNAGLDIETVHSDFSEINSMWLTGKKGDEKRDFLIQTVNTAAALKIHTVIVHLSSGNTPPEFCNIGVQRYSEVLECAEQKNVNIAFENLRLTSYLDKILKKVNSQNAKFCFDAGHENIYNGGQGVLESHADKLVAFHFHDNFAKVDDHILPGDGSIDWKKMFLRIAPYLNKIPFTVEAYAAPNYSETDFYEKAMQSIKKIVL
ncbi:MAG: sugar phosphate isomerase/epimerase [Clostridia bacterium]